MPSYREALEEARRGRGAHYFVGGGFTYVTPIDEGAVVVNNWPSLIYADALKLRRAVAQFEDKTSVRLARVVRSGQNKDEAGQVRTVIEACGEITC